MWRKALKTNKSVMLLDGRISKERRRKAGICRRCRRFNLKEKSTRAPSTISYGILLLLLLSMSRSLCIDQYCASLL